MNSYNPKLCLSNPSTYETFETLTSFDSENYEEWSGYVHQISCSNSFTITIEDSKAQHRTNEHDLYLEALYQTYLSELIRPAVKLHFMSVHSRALVYSQTIEEVLQSCLSPSTDFVLTMHDVEDRLDRLFGSKLFQDSGFRVANVLADPRPHGAVPVSDVLQELILVESCSLPPHPVQLPPAQPGPAAPLTLPMQFPRLSVLANRALVHQHHSPTPFSSEIYLHIHHRRSSSLSTASVAAAPLDRIALRFVLDDFIHLVTNNHISELYMNLVVRPRLLSRLFLPPLLPRAPLPHIHPLLLAFLIYPLCHSRIDLAFLSQTLLDIRPLYDFIHSLFNQLNSTLSGFDLPDEVDTFFSARSTSGMLHDFVWPASEGDRADSRRDWGSDTNEDDTEHSAMSRLTVARDQFQEINYEDERSFNIQSRH